MQKKYVYFFASDKAEGSKEMKALLGGKGAGLAEMAKIGIPVPPGFTIITETCQVYEKNGNKIPEYVMDEVKANLIVLEQKMNRKLGDPENPLLVSVRSGAAVSMPGMMDTVLNLGMNEKTLEGMVKKTNNPRFGWDAYRRLIQMFGDIVMEIPHKLFEEVLMEQKKKRGVKLDIELNVDDLKEIVAKYKVLFKENTKMDFPEDVFVQLRLAIEAVFKSWNNPRAISYRKINEITGLLGTAVNVQAMVFGNMGETSGTGVAFTRNPNTGEKKVFGEILMNAQGEDVVAGIRTPISVEELERIQKPSFDQFIEICKKLEAHYRDMQDVEFTIQEGNLYFLQTRTGKRTAHAALQIALDFVDERVISENEAVLRIEPKTLQHLLHPQVDPKALCTGILLGKGLAASPGAAVGQIVFNAARALEWKKQGKDVILVREETSPEDIEGMNAARGILTARGGMTSHAAVVCRGMGKCCVCGCGDIKEINDDTKKGVAYMIMHDKKFIEGDVITVIGTSGQVYDGALPLVDPDMSSPNFTRLMGWADSIRVLKVRANADTPRDAENAIKFGAQGIGLCRTEHMFFEGPRIKAMRQMILASNVEDRQVALDKLIEFQIQDFKGLFKIMKNRPVTIRTLDPPLHEFLPKDEKDIIEIAKEMHVEEQTLINKIKELHEFNPMLGWRGCRLGIIIPEITIMQCKAIFLAAAETDVLPEIMIPLVGFSAELQHQKEVVEKVHKECEQLLGKKIDYKFGTMIEVPRGALMSWKIAQDAEFFSFGTNDLTQMTCGFSRDDAGRFLSKYIDINILEHDPFTSIDRLGVGELMKIAVKGGKKTRPDIKLGICGEHGGEASSVEFCHMLGLHYVSCSPFRLPIARLAAAHAQLKYKYGMLLLDE